MNYAVRKVDFGAYADSEDRDQTAHARSLITTFADRLQIHRIL